MEEKASIQDRFIVFPDFGAWCLISGQSRKILDGWNLCYVLILSHTSLDQALRQNLSMKQNESDIPVFQWPKLDLDQPKYDKEMVKLRW